jgi:hypothetical protein
MSDAERKARQRAGYVQIYVEVHMPTLTAALLAEGHITDAQTEDRDAIREGAAKFVAQHSKVGRILRDKKEPAEVKRQKPTKPKRQDKPKHGPTRKWTPEEIEAWESGKLRPYGVSLFNCLPSGVLPPDWSDRGKSGDRDGRNRSRITGSFKSERKEPRAKKIKQLTPAEVKRLEKPYEDELKVTDASPYFVETSAKGAMHIHDLKGGNEDD